MKLLFLTKLKCLTPTCSPLPALRVNKMLADLNTSLLSLKAAQNIFMNNSLKFLFSSISGKASEKVHLQNHALKIQVQIFARGKSLKLRNAKKISSLEKGAEERVVKEVSKMFQATNPALCKKAQNLQMFQPIQKAKCIAQSLKTKSVLMKAHNNRQLNPLTPKMPSMTRVCNFMKLIFFNQTSNKLKSWKTFQKKKCFRLNLVRQKQINISTVQPTMKRYSCLLQALFVRFLG